MPYLFTASVDLLLGIACKITTIKGIRKDLGQNAMIGDVPAQVPNYGLEYDKYPKTLIFVSPGRAR